MKSYDDKIDEMRKLFEHHNNHNDPKLNIDELVERLKHHHPSDDALSLLGYSDLMPLLGISADLAKDVVRSWRGAGRDERERIKVIVDATPEAEAARLSLEELIEKYDPNDPSNAFGARLATLAGKDSNQNPSTFLIFNGDALDKQATFEELRRLRAGLPSRPIAIHHGIPHETFAVGSRPARYKDENPWNPQEALYEGESNAGVKWMELDLKTRQLVSIASTSNQPDFQKYTEFGLFALLRGSPDPFRTVARLFPIAATQFHDLQRKGSLPSMKVPVGADSTTAAPSAPASPSSGGTTPPVAGPTPSTAGSAPATAGS
jgi:hypothetical protein